MKQLSLKQRQPNHFVTRLPSHLRAIAMEGKCQQQHGGMRESRGWRHCPWCGVSLLDVIVCDHCGRKFISREAYHVHRAELAFYQKNTCPVGTNHPVKHLKFRNKMFCVTCHKEYDIKFPKDSKEGVATC